jgi:trehalose synthase
MGADAITLDSYREVTPPGAVDVLLRLAERARGRRFVHVNSTRAGGGVAEILHRLVPLLNDLGIIASWEVIEGDPDFFLPTKALHNALQGTTQTFTPTMLAHYAEVNQRNASSSTFSSPASFATTSCFWCSSRPKEIRAPTGTHDAP